MKFDILDSSHCQCHCRVKMSPRHSTTNTDSYHECEAVPQTNVEEPPEELVTSRSITKHHLGHGTVSKQDQGKGTQSLSQELP